MINENRFLIAGCDPATHSAIISGLSRFVDRPEISIANDGSDAIFKLSNVTFQIVFLAKDLAKHNCFQITEWMADQQRLQTTAAVLLCEVPPTETFVDDVVIGRVQFVPDVANTGHLESALSRALNFISRSDQPAFQLKFLATGEILMRQGESAENVYLVKKGRLKAVHKAGECAVLLGFIEVGEFVGEMAYINGEPRLADVEAIAPCELIEIPVQQLDSILFQRPSWSKALMKTLSRRLKSTVVAVRAE